MNNILKANNGIIQSEFIKMFDTCIQQDVRDRLHTLETNGVITRVKSGRSYSINLK